MTRCARNSRGSDTHTCTGGPYCKGDCKPAANKGHKHLFDLHPTYPTTVSCTVCGFSTPAIILKSKTSLDAIIARKHCSQAVLDLLGIDRDGNTK